MISNVMMITSTRNLNNHLMKFILTTQVVIFILSGLGLSSADAFPLDLNLNHVTFHEKKPTMTSNHFNQMQVQVGLGSGMGINVPRGGARNGTGHKAVTKLRMVPPSIVATTFDNAPMIQSFAIIGGANLVGFVISLLTGSHLHLDLFGTGAFALSTLPTLLSSMSMMAAATTAATETLPRVMVSSIAVAVWGTKLTSFLFYRALQVKHDARLDETLSTVSGTSTFWVLTLLWGIICSLPHTLGTTSSNPGNPITLTVGTAVYVLGLVTESMADYQKWQFKKNNPGEFCNVGLWSISQHPNFFGNLLLWFGIFIMNADSLVVVAQSSGEGGATTAAAGKDILSTIWESRRVAIALLSPLFMWTLFNGQASGAMTNTVELANAKYGKDPSYQSYVKNVPLIIPNLFEWLKKLFSF